MGATLAAADPLAFRNAMSRFASGVTVVTTLDGEQTPVGFTASAFSSLSLEPPLILVCLDRKAESHRAFADAKTMGVSILAEDQAALALRFAKRGEEKFSGGTVAGPLTGCHVVEGALAQLECEIAELLPGGDHSIIVGRVIGVTLGDASPMVHFNRSFGRFTPA